MLNQALLPEYDQEMATTRKILAGMPEDKLDWKPHEKCFSMHDLALHIANIPNWLEQTIDESGLDLAQAFDPPKGGSKQAVLDHFEASVKRGRELLATAADATLMSPWTLSANGNPMFTAPRIGVVRSFVFSHLIHHRAQLALYLRLNNVPVPSIYGPTADDDPFKAALDASQGN